jgi:hypothetical protein
VSPAGPAAGGADFAWVLFALGIVLTLAVAVVFVWLLARGGNDRR